MSPAARRMAVNRTRRMQAEIVSYREEVRDLRDTCTERLRMIQELEAGQNNLMCEVERLERHNKLLNEVLDDYAEADACGGGEY